MMQNGLEFLASSHQSRALLPFYCGWEDCRPGHSFGPAIRSHYLFHYVYKGCGYYTVKKKVYRVTAGQGFLICPGESTFYEADTQDPWSYCWFSFDGLEAKSILENCGITEDQLIYQDHSNGMIKNAIFKLIHNYESGQQNEYQILSDLYAIFSNMKLSRPNVTCITDKSYSEKALEFIVNHFSYEIKVHDIAKYVGIDRTYLYKIFMQVYHCSPQQYLIRFRLNMACTLLDNTNMNITEIAYSCGFKDAPAFYKHFKKVFAMTPIQYRIRNRKASLENIQE